MSNDLTQLSYAFMFLEASPTGRVIKEVYFGSQKKGEPHTKGC